MTTLPVGSTYDDNELPLPCDILWEKDIPVTLRDGTVIYVDILRPTGSGKFPAIMAWSPYGKILPQGPAMSVPTEWFSGIAKFEGPDAAFWVNHGYAIVNVDVRGAYMSGGKVSSFGVVDRYDGYDMIEWTARQNWSNGNVGMHGTSWLSASQWFIAATRPPHLKAIAPWNGVSDVYRNTFNQGGMPDMAFSSGLSSTLVCPNGVEDVNDMLTRYPLMNEYWDDKRARVENITVPAYVGADIATYLHSSGTLDAFHRLGSAKKWLRVNSTNEWYDQYDPANENDLLLFFNRYLKGEKNNWEATPKVRVPVMDPGIDGSDLVNVGYTDWPLPDTTYQKLYLSAGDNLLSANAPQAENSVSYDATNGEVVFTITFTENIQITGHLMARLYVEADQADDMDIFVLVKKLDHDGTELQPSELSTFYFPLSGTGVPGQQRVSMRMLDKDKSTSYLPVLACTTPQKLSKGQVVPVDIAINPTSMRWHAGQKLTFTISGYRQWGLPITPINSGTHIIHTGGDTASYIQIPVVAWSN
jgi:predicted acyl esterase